MALSPRRTNAAATAACDAMAVLCNAGFLDIYDGAQPTNADTAVGAQVKLASLPLSATAFAGAVNGVATANAITSDAAADATGTAAWFRVFKSDHTTAVWDDSVGTSGAGLNLNSVAIQVGAAVSVTAWTLTEGKG